MAAAKSAVGISLSQHESAQTRASVFFYVQPSSTRNFSYGGLGRSSLGSAGFLSCPVRLILLSSPPVISLTVAIHFANPKDRTMKNQLAFHEIQFNVVNQNDQPWLTAVQIAQALGYSSEKSISNLYRRNADEFSPCMTLVINSMTNGINNSLRENEMRIFSLRGAHLIAMFSRTERAKEFRRWVLDILDAEVGAATPAPAAQFNDEDLQAWLGSGEPPNTCSTPSAMSTRPWRKQGTHANPPSTPSSGNIHGSFVRHKPCSPPQHRTFSTTHE